MIGRFLEYSVATPDIQASYAFYSSLGFAQADVGEAWPHRYAVMSDGRLHIGLHEQTDFPASLTFVRPDLPRHMAALEAAGIEFEFLRLGDAQFNEVGWFEPGGHLIRLIEARTFSPLPARNATASLCGYFQEVALPTPDLETAKRYWERLGFVGLDADDGAMPHVACTSDSLELGLYEAAEIKTAMLRFDVGDSGASPAREAALSEFKWAPSARLPAALRGTTARLLLAPEGTALLLEAVDTR